MGLIRWILGALIAFLDRLFAPKAPVRLPADQKKLDAQTSKLALYELAACPFCVKVHRHIARRGLTIELRDVKRDPRFHEELVREGGTYQVPCLRIVRDDGKVEWMYESADIIAYLDARFPATI